MSGHLINAFLVLRAAIAWAVPRIDGHLIVALIVLREGIKPYRGWIHEPLLFVASCLEKLGKGAPAGYETLS